MSMESLRYDPPKKLGPPVVHEIVNQLHDPYILDYYVIPAAVLVVLSFLYCIGTRFQKKKVKPAAFEIVKPD